MTCDMIALLAAGLVGLSPTSVADAKTVAARAWGGAPCGGRIEITARHRPRDRHSAVASWTYPVGQPTRRLRCRITFNSAQAFTYLTFCSVLIHEYGHLAGREQLPQPAIGDVPGRQRRPPLPTTTARAVAA